VTEYIIVYKPRGRPVNYPYKLFRQIGPLTTFSLNLHAYNTAALTGTFVSLYSGSTTFAAQQFQAPPSQTYVTGAQFGAGRLFLSKTGSPTGTVTVTLRADSGSNTPGTTLATVATFDASTLGTGANIEWEIPAGTSLTFDARYWLVINYAGGNSSNTVNVHRTSDSLTGLRSATSTTGTTWTTSSTSWFSIGVRFRYLYSYTLSFPYTSAFQSEKRISQLVECVSSTGTVISGGLEEETVTVNSQSVTPPLVKETAIPQATSYTLTGRFLHKRFASELARFTTTPYLYFTDPDLNVEDLGASEAYLLRVVFAENGSILRVNGLTDSDLYGNANTAIDFADLAIPIRRLEWIYGSGECIILVID
jgi:hypothetical protein